MLLEKHLCPCIPNKVPYTALPGPGVRVLWEACLPNVRTMYTTSHGQDGHS